NRTRRSPSGTGPFPPRALGTALIRAYGEAGQVRRVRDGGTQLVQVIAIVGADPAVAGTGVAFEKPRFAAAVDKDVDAHVAERPQPFIEGRHAPAGERENVRQERRSPGSPLHGEKPG